jgi:hypothetical protein
LTSIVSNRENRLAAQTPAEPSAKRYLARPAGEQGMEWTPVKSALIEAVRYDPDIQRLDIHFVSGEISHFGVVPAKVVEALIAAESPGTYYMDEIRRVYPRL